MSATALVAIATPTFYEVRCGGCGATLPAPDSALGMRLWWRDELAATVLVYCRACGVAQRIVRTQEVPN